MPIVIPVVHMNGDSRATLISQNRAVYDKAKDLLDALAEASPNGRNFYTISDDAMRQAVTEARARYAAVQAIKSDMETILVAIMGDD